LIFLKSTGVVVDVAAMQRDRVAFLTSFIDHQAEKNRETEGLWNSYGPHRQRIDSILERLSDREKSLAILGAGNGNDLQLDRLIERFGRVSLLDCDSPAMARACQRLPARAAADIERIEFDVTGCFGALDAAISADGPLAPHDVITTLGSRPAAPPPGSPFDRVVSLCMLSQLIDHLSHYLPAESPVFASAVDTLRTRHLQLLLQWTRPGGFMLLFLDFVSSDTAPALRTTDSASLPELLEILFKKGNFFLGLHPGAMVEQLQQNPALAEWVDHVEIASPWLWNMGERSYAVTCLRVSRSERVSETPS